MCAPKQTRGSASASNGVTTATAASSVCSHYHRKEAAVGLQTDPPLVNVKIYLSCCKQLIELGVYFRKLI